MTAVLLTILMIGSSVLKEHHEDHRPAVVEAFAQSRSLQALGFLVGRWSGQAPDGTTFYEEYKFGAEGQFRSQRFQDGTFTTATDGSSVAVEGDQIVSRWGPYAWRAVRLEDGLAEFEPISAPSSFSWKRLDADRVEISQRWVDEAGAAQGYTLVLSRVSP